MSWAAVDRRGFDLATGRAPVPPGAMTPAAALAAAPVATWPVAVLSDDARSLGLGGALGAGGDRVERLVERLMSSPRPPGRDATRALVRSTPLGPLDLPVEVVPLREGVEAVERLDVGWIDRLDERRSVPRRPLADAGRGTELEAALHVALLLATERLDPALDPVAPGRCAAFGAAAVRRGAERDDDAHVASGAQLWLLGGAVAWCLFAAADRDPFAAWAELVVAGWWPVGPSGGRLVVAWVAPGAAQ